MGDSIIQMLVISVFIEAIVQVIKGIVKRRKEFAVWDIVSMGLGIIIAYLMKINLLDGIIVTDTDGETAKSLLYILSGVALGRGPAFIHDLWAKLRLSSSSSAPSTEAKAVGALNTSNNSDTSLAHDVSTNANII